jgi:hypothetical protein
LRTLDNSLWCLSLLITNVHDLTHTHPCFLSLNGRFGKQGHGQQLPA